MIKTIHIRIDDNELLEVEAQRGEGTKVILSNITHFIHGNTGQKVLFREMEPDLQERVRNAVKEEFKP